VRDRVNQGYAAFASSYIRPVNGLAVLLRKKPQKDRIQNMTPDGAIIDCSDKVPAEVRGVIIAAI
jgi:hypothetical protein